MCCSSTPECSLALLSDTNSDLLTVGNERSEVLEVANFRIILGMRRDEVRF